jgi:hypothetical protein
VRRRTRFCSSCREIARTARLKRQTGSDARQHLNASRAFRSCGASLIVGRHSLAGRAMKNLLRRISESPRAVERAKFERRHPLRLRARATPVVQTVSRCRYRQPFEFCDTRNEVLPCENARRAIFQPGGSLPATHRCLLPHALRSPPILPVFDLVRLTLFFGSLHRNTCGRAGSSRRMPNHVRYRTR